MTSPETADMSTPPAEERVPVRFLAQSGTENRPLIEIRGHDVTRLLSGIQIVSDPIAGTRVAVELAPHRLGAVEFEGLAVVEINTYSDDPGPAAAAFLGAMDAESVEKAALRRLDLGTGPHATTEAILRTLIEWANGEGSLT